MSKLHDRCIGGYKVQVHEGATTSGEAKTLASITHGIDAEEVEYFISLVITHCQVCGKHGALLETDMPDSEALEALNMGIGAIILYRHMG